MFNASGMETRSTASSTSYAPNNTAGRVLLHIHFLTSVSHHVSQHVLHLFQLSEQSAAGVTAFGGRPQRRIIALADELTPQLEMDMAIQRCVQISHLTQATIPIEDVGTLNAPLVALDYLLQQTSMLDFVRTVGCLFKPASSGVPLFLLGETLPVGDLVAGHSSTSANVVAVPLQSVSRDLFAVYDVRSGCAAAGEHVIFHSRNKNALRELQESHLREMERVRVNHQRETDAHFAQIMELEATNAVLRHSLKQRDELIAQLRTSSGVNHTSLFRQSVFTAGAGGSHQDLSPAHPASPSSMTPFRAAGADYPQSSAPTIVGVRLPKTESCNPNAMDVGSSVRSGGVFNNACVTPTRGVGNYFGVR